MTQPTSMPDKAADGARNDPPADRRRRAPPVIPLTVAAGFFMEGLDSTILNTALPRAARSLGTTPIQMSLAVTSYLLALAVFIPISGWLADRFGARRVFCAAIVAFTSGSLLCGFAGSLGELVAARIVQGLGGAMMTPVGRLILARCFPRDQLIAAISYTAIPGLVGPMLGPVMGGFLTTYLAWQWIFFINLPIGAIGLTLALRYIPVIPGTDPPPFDVAGFAQLGVGLACTQLAIELSSHRIARGPVEAALVAVAALMALLYRRHARRVPNPVIDLDLFRIRSFSVSVLWGALSRIGILASPFLLPLLFQVGFGMSPLRSGLLVCLASFGAMFSRVGSPALMRRVGLRGVLIGNAALLAAMIAGFALFRPTTPVYLIAPYIFVFGIARTIQFAALSALSFDLPDAKISNGTSASVTAQRLAQSGAVAIAAALMSWVSGPGRAITLDGFAFVFCVVAVLVALSVIGFSRLTAEDGRRLTGRRRATPVPEDDA